MVVKSKINVIKTIIVAGIISAFLLAITAVLPSVADSTNSDNAQDIGITATKTAEWTTDDYTKGKVQITAKATGRDEFMPNVLFVGTLCGAHDLSVHTIEASLNAIAANCNVDYFFYNNDESDAKSTPDFNNTLTEGHNFKEQMSPEIQAVYQAETWNQEKGKWDTSLVTRNHQALKKFLDCIYTQIIEKQKSYDFIVLEFDRTRISDWYRNLSPDDEPSPPTIPSGDYSKSANESAVANTLANYYKNKQVIWITDSNIIDGDLSSLYRPDTKMNVRTYDVNTRTINYNSLKALLAPAIYVNTTDTPSSSDDDLRQIEKGLSNAPFSDENILGFDRQVGYADSGKSGDFLKQAIESLYEYQIFDVDGLTPLDYYFIEDVPEGYEASYNIDKSSPITWGNTVITNTYIAPPGPGPQPIPTPDPGNVTPVGYGSVKTGDIINIISLLIIATIGGTTIAIINRLRNKKNKERG